MMDFHSASVFSRRKAICRKCEFGRSGMCADPNSTVHGMNTVAAAMTPDAFCARWKEVRPTSGMSWFLADLAKGGISRFASTVIPLLHDIGYPTKAVVVGSTFMPDEPLIKDLKRYCRVYQTEVPHQSAGMLPADMSIYQQLMNDSSLVHIAARQPGYSPLPSGLLRPEGTRVLAHAHGMCGWTLKVLKYLSQWATHYYGSSSRAAENATENGYPAHHAIVPIDRNRLTPSVRAREARKQLLPESSDGEIWLTFVGRLSPEKGISRIAETARWISDNCDKRVRLILVGDGYDRDNQIESVLSVMGGVPWNHFDWMQDLSSVFSASSLTLCMSDAEGMPLTVLESLISCCPVAAYGEIGCMPLLRGWSLSGRPKPLFLELPYKSTGEESGRVVLDFLNRRSFAHRIPSDYVDAEETARLYSYAEARRQWGELMMSVLA